MHIFRFNFESRIQFSWYSMQAGDVVYTDVDKQGGGIVEFSSKAGQVTLGLVGSLNKIEKTSL